MDKVDMRYVCICNLIMGNIMPPDTNTGALPVAVHGAWTRCIFDVAYHDERSQTRSRQYCIGVERAKLGKLFYRVATTGIASLSRDVSCFYS